MDGVDNVAVYIHSVYVRFDLAQPKGGPRTDYGKDKGREGRHQKVEGHN